MSADKKIASDVPPRYFLRPLWLKNAQKILQNEKQRGNGKDRMTQNLVESCA